MTADVETSNMLGDAFDPKGELLIYEHCRPHWSQAGAVVFITFRTADSIPREVVRRWEDEKQDWLRRHGLDTGAHWSAAIATLSEKERTEFHKEFNRTREEFLDMCHGRCLLKRPWLSQIVADTLLHFDGQRYRMGDFVVMPNHVHLLCVFPSPEAMKEQCDSWLHYSAYRINQAIGETGTFWQHEPFDHLLRSPRQRDTSMCDDTLPTIRTSHAFKPASIITAGSTNNVVCRSATERPFAERKATITTIIAARD